ncbi:putative chromatin-remodeling complex subunit IES6 [Elsinoe australis]|uniref:Putative chromatin-remodeling complex subunit IES6 n=1 Tax=Elsinoe australis TaxID=40998 RepID=A0A4U7AMS8_9PEZI|nr:putative chromatin-remodeling complex subunit IES6 [Elsinoe australis]
MAPITTASNEENHHALLDKLDMHKIHKPFRNPNWRPPQRRNKNLKQILSEAQRREQSLLNTQNNSGTSTPQAATTGDGASLSANPAQGSSDLSRAVLEKTIANGNGATLQPPATGTSVQQPSYSWTSIAAAPSFKPKQRYCDITGLPAPYIDPKSGLRYANKEVYAVVRTLGTGSVQEYLAARGANTVLK